MIVRTMLPQEIDITINLFGQYFQELYENTNGNLPDYDENSVIELVRKYSSLNNLVWLNAYEGQRPVGFLAGSFGRCHWNKNIIKAHIDFIYAMPGRSINSLVDKFMEHVNTVGATEIILTDMNGKSNQQAFEQLGFKQVQLMIKEISE